MRNFFKIFTASCLGTLGALLLLVLILTFIGIWSSSSKFDVENKSIIKIEFKGPIPEMTDNISGSSSIFSQQDRALGLRAIKKLIRKASTDKNIAGIVINGGSSDIPPATALSVRNSLKEFRTEGKFVYAYDEYYSQLGYFLSSTADSIFLNPNGAIEFKGFAVAIPHFKEVMDKVGVEMNVFYAGDFKSATEPYRRMDMSEQNKLQTRSYLHSISDSYLQEISDSRNIDTDQLYTLMDELKIQNGEDAVTYGLADNLLYKSEFLDFVKDKLGFDDRKDIPFISLEQYEASFDVDDYESDNKIALIYAEGEIIFEDQAKGAISENRYEKICDQILEDDNIKAVVLRVNSPGGSSLTSDIIWHRIEELKAQDKFVMASYGDYAASGGYYISCGADSIIAQKNTLTGSIGVYSMFPNVKKLVVEKIGIHFDTVKTASHAIVGSPFFDLSNSEKEVFQNSTDEIYDNFLTRVSDGRNMSKEEVHKIAQGRIWSGTQAKENGLIDGIGNLNDAIAIAAERVGIENYQVVEYPEIEKDFYESLLRSIPSGVYSKLIPPTHDLLSAGMKEKLELLNKWSSTNEPLARLPLTFEY